MVGRSARRCAHQQRGRGLVAAHQQHDAVERMGADRLLDVHGGEVAEQHGRRPHRHLAERRDREFERKPASVQHAVADMLGDGAEMRVAGVQLGPGVADADDRAALELVLREAAVLQERAVVEPHLVLACRTTPRCAGPFSYPGSWCDLSSRMPLRRSSSTRRPEWSRSPALARGHGTDRP